MILAWASPFNLLSAKVLEYKAWRPKGVYNLKSSEMCYLALSYLFEYLYYGSTAIINTHKNSNSTLLFFYENKQIF